MDKSSRGFQHAPAGHLALPQDRALGGQPRKDQRGRSRENKGDPTECVRTGQHQPHSHQHLMRTPASTIEECAAPPLQRSHQQAVPTRQRPLRNGGQTEAHVPACWTLGTAFPDGNLHLHSNCPCAAVLHRPLFQEDPWPN